MNTQEGLIRSGVVIDIYVVHETVDERSYKGRLVGVCRTEAKAKEMAKKKGWFGSDGSIEKTFGLLLDYSREPRDEILILTNDPRPLPLNLNLIDDRKAKVAQAKEKLANSMSIEELNLLSIDLEKIK